MEKSLLSDYNKYTRAHYFALVDTLRWSTSHITRLEDAWEVDGFTPTSNTRYDKSFKDVIPTDSRRVIDFIKTKRQELGRRLNVLDVFGHAPFLEREEDLINIDKLYCMRLEDYVDERGSSWSRFDKNIFQKELRHSILDERMILGDAFLDYPWIDLKNTMAKDEITTFDLITIRPLGPFQVAPSQYLFNVYPDSSEYSEDKKSFLEKRAMQYINAYYYRMFTKVFKLLDKNNGLLLSQIPYLAGHSNGADFEKNLLAYEIFVQKFEKEHPGIIVKFNFNKDFYFPVMSMQWNS